MIDLRLKLHIASRKVLPEGAKLFGILSEGGGLILVRGCSLSLALLLVPIITRLLGPDGYGQYVLVISASLFLGLFIHLGLPTFITREVAASLAGKSYSKAAGIEVFSLRMILVMSLLCSLVFLLLTNQLSFIEQIGALKPFAFVIIAISIAYALHQRALAILSGRKRMILSQIPEGVLRPIALLALLLVFVDLFPRTLDGILNAYVVATFGSLLVGTWLISRTSPAEQYDRAPTTYPSQWLRELPPFTVIGLVGIAQAHGDVLLLAGILPISEVGEYKLAAFIGSIPMMFHAILISMLLPRAAAASAQGDIGQLSKLAIGTSRASFLFALLYAVCVFILGSPAIKIFFGTEFSQVYSIACLTILIPLFTTFVGSSFSMLNMSGNATISSQIALIGLACGLGGMWLGATHWGAQGAAGAAVIGAAISALMSWIAVRARLEIRCDAFAPNYSR